MECIDKRYQIILQMVITLCCCVAKTAAAKYVREVLLVRGARRCQGYHHHLAGLRRCPVDTQAQE